MSETKTEVFSLQVSLVPVYMRTKAYESDAVYSLVGGEER